ncbi:MAG: hypothetical protein VZQ51_07405 [Bacteroidales bacterium]|nr:hypothetical protein [Bacteroidales bacterium]
MKKVLMVCLMLLIDISYSFAQSANRFANGRVAGETWTEYHNNAEFVMVQKSDGTINSGYKSECWMCNGSGKCSLCHGQGGQSAYVYNRYVYTQCTSCFGRGICSSCNGTGKSVKIWDILYPKANFPQLTNNPNFFKWSDNYLQMVNNSSNSSSRSNNNGDNYSSNSSSRNDNNTSPERCAQYVRSYNLFARILSDMGSYSNPYSDSRRRELQNDMRRIRNENASCGCPSIAKSTWEDWDGIR